MANGHGGYRRPANPAPVSGPGNLSQRTDGGPGSKQAIASLPDAGYGEQAEFKGIQEGAPIRKGGAASPTSAGAPGGMLPPPLDAPSGRADEPVTYGAEAGEGPGMDALGLLNQAQLEANDIAYMKRYLPTLQYMVDMNPDAPTSTLALVRYLRSQV